MKAWLAICAVLGGGAAAMAWTQGLASPFEDAATEPLAWNAASWASHPWTLWTAAWVHTSAGGLAGNLLALAALAVVGAAADVGRAPALALAFTARNFRSRLVACVARKGSREDKRPARKARVLERRAFFGHLQAFVLKPLDKVLVRRFGEKISNALSNDGPYFGDFFELIHGRFGKFRQRREMAGEELSGAFADKPNSQPINQPRKTVIFAGRNFIEQVLRRFFRHAFERSHIF